MENNINVDAKVVAKLKGAVSLHELVQDDPENAEELIDEHTIEGSGDSDSEDNRANVQSP